MHKLTKAGPSPLSKRFLLTAKTTAGCASDADWNFQICTVNASALQILK